jgi:F0F1-type ATP synthase assembly protein I
MLGDKEERSKIFGALALVTGLGLTMVIAVGVCGVLGYFADRWLTTSPVLLIAGILTGVVAGALQAYRLILKQLDKEDK